MLQAVSRLAMERDGAGQVLDRAILHLGTSIEFHKTLLQFTFSSHRLFLAEFSSDIAGLFLSNRRLLGRPRSILNNLVKRFQVLLADLCITLPSAIIKAQ